VSASGASGAEEGNGSDDSDRSGGMTTAPLDPDRKGARAWHDAPTCPKCGGPGVGYDIMTGCHIDPPQLRCAACGHYWDASPVELAKAAMADAAYLRHETRVERGGSWAPKRSGKRAAPSPWLPGIAKRVEAADEKTLAACGANHIPLGASMAIALSVSAGARVEFIAGGVLVIGGTKRIDELMRPTGATETTICNRRAWCWTRG
jgi:hypothetical protein